MSGQPPPQPPQPPSGRGGGPPRPLGLPGPGRATTRGGFRGPAMPSNPPPPRALSTPGIVPGMRPPPPQNIGHQMRPPFPGQGRPPPPGAISAQRPPGTARPAFATQAPPLASAAGGMPGSSIPGRPPPGGQASSLQDLPSLPRLPPPRLPPPRTSQQPPGQPPRSTMPVPPPPGQRQDRTSQQPPVRVTTEGGGPPVMGTGRAAFTGSTAGPRGSPDLASMSLASGGSSTVAEASGGRKITPPPSGSSSVGRGAARGTLGEAGGSEHAGKIARTRPDSVVSKVGKGGREVALTTNYFAMSRRPDWNLFQYRVDIQPEEDVTKVRKAIVWELMRRIGLIAFDGTMLYTTNRLNPDPMMLTTQKLPPRGVSGAPIPCTVTIRFAREVFAGDIAYVHVLNTIMRNGMACLGLEQIGRDYFDPAAKIEYRQHRLQLWPGYKTSIRQHENSLLLCCDTIAKILRLDTVLDQMRQTLRSSKNNTAAVTKTMLGRVVMSMYNRKTYTVADVEWGKNPEHCFKGRKGEMISLMSYYKDRYHLEIKDRSQPLLVAKVTERDRRRYQHLQQQQDQGPVLLIPELCLMTGLDEDQRQNRALMTDLADVTRAVPERRIESLLRFSARFNGCEAARQVLGGAGLEFKPSLERIPGRVLEPETIRHGRGETKYMESNAEWGARNFKMFGATLCQKWVVLFPGDRDGKAEELTNAFITLLVSNAAQIGFPLSRPLQIKMSDSRSATYVRYLKEVIAEKRPAMIMAVVPNNTGIEYETIKKVCCVEMPIPSQVMTMTVLRKERALPSVAMKVAIQMATKLGGEPWFVDIPLKDVMIVGYDSFHDTTTPGKSVGAVVSTTNSILSRFCSSVAIHSNREELHNQMKISITKALRAYNAANRVLPRRIIIYRDGVGDGDIDYVKEIEIERIKSAIADCYKELQLPLFTFVIVSKRINTRFFLDKKNPPSGTVVDDVVTLPERYDFFLVSQSVRQGTVNPTSYNVIEDNSGLAPERLQKLTYKLTHTYYNWPGTVRVPAVCQYAHKLAYLVGNSLHQRPHDDLDQLLYFL